MSGRHSWNTLRDPIMSDPKRKARVEAHQRSMRAMARLSNLREQRGVTQQAFADALAVSQANVSRIEHEDDVYLSTLRSYVEALGGRLNLVAVFSDGAIPLGELSDKQPSGAQ